VKIAEIDNIAFSVKCNARVKVGQRLIFPEKLGCGAAADNNSLDRGDICYVQCRCSVREDMSRPVLLYVLLHVFADQKK
jgi:hypothetical protein